MINRLIIVLGLIFPAFLSFVFIYYNMNILAVESLKLNIIVVLIIDLICKIINRRTINTIIYTSALFTLTSVSFIEISHIYLYKNTLSASTLFILFETNNSEIKEFIQMYFDGNLLTLSIIFISVFTLTMFFIIKNYKRLTNNKTHKKSSKKNFLLIAISIILLFPLWNLKRESILYTFLKSYQEYKKEIAEYDKFAFSKKGSFVIDSISNSKNKNKVFVIIIGESATKNHMSLYNYYRNTNPLLSDIKNELLIYNNIITPHTHTITALEKVLTLSNYENNTDKFNGSAIQLFNKAGYKTYWISNQRPTGIWDTFVTSISKSSEKRFFINTAHNSSKTPFDEELLKPLKKCLSEKYDNKLIIIHLLGSHADYKERYPEEFSKFNDEPNTLFKSAKAFKTINEYDNSVLYNDYVVYNIINSIKELKTKSCVLYLSDHGEDVFQTINTSNHTETKGTEPMYEIPFILWRSTKYKENCSQFVFDTTRKYMTDDLIFTLADLASIKFHGFDATRSLVNKEFNTNRKRMIYNNNDFDKLY